MLVGDMRVSSDNGRACWGCRPDVGMVRDGLARDRPGSGSQRVQCCCCMRRWSAARHPSPGARHARLNASQRRPACGLQGAPAARLARWCAGGGPGGTARPAGGLAGGSRWGA